MISKMIDGQEVLMSGTSEALIAQKADKVASATNGNIASLDANGNLTDSGVKGDVSTTTLNGNPLSFTTDSEQVAKECIITLEPIQAGSGDPSPSNIRAISGYDKVELSVPRKNLFNINDKYITREGISGIYTIIGDTITIQSSDQVADAYAGFTIPVVVGNTYTLTNKANGQSGYFRILQSDTILSVIPGPSGTTVIDSGTSIQATKPYLIVILLANYNQTVFSDIQVELGSAATAYEPYNPVTDYSESLPETVYGGTLNVETGELVVDKGYVDLSTLTFSPYYSAYKSEPISGIIIPASTYAGPYVICSVKKGTFQAGYGANSIVVTGDGCLQTDTLVTSGEAVYYLATPYTIHLTPAQVRLLQGSNVVTTNGTSIKLTYRNGEVATLADVSSVAESVNALGEKVEEVEDIKKYITFVGDYFTVFYAVRVGKIVNIAFGTNNNFEWTDGKKLFELKDRRFSPLVYYGLSPLYQHSDGRIVSDGAVWIENWVDCKYYGPTKTGRYEVFLNYIMRDDVYID